MVLLSVSSGTSVGHQRVSSFFLHHDWFICQLQTAWFLRKGSHEGLLFRMFPLSLQSIVSNQMRPRRLGVPGLVASYDIRPEDGVGLFYALEPTWG